MKRGVTASDLCRTFGHAWFEIDADRPSPIGWYMWVKCDRCNTVRMDTLDIHGDLSARSYRYPDGYREAEKISRASYRMRLINARPKSGKRAAA